MTRADATTTRVVGALLTGLLVWVSGACSEDAGPDGAPGGGPAASGATPDSPTSEASDGSDDSAWAVPDGARLEVRAAALEWREIARVALSEEAPVSAPVGEGVETAVDRGATSATVIPGDGPGLEHRAADGYRIVDLQLDGGRLLVVEETADEDRPGPPRATLYDLDSGDATSLADAADAPAPAQGAWSLRGDTLVYPHQPRASAYCLMAATLGADGLAGAAVEQVHCVSGRHGIRGQQVTPTGLGWVDFDDSRPSCLTPWTRLGSAAPQQMAGAQRCDTWQVLPLDAAGTVAWTTSPDPEQVEAGDLYAATADGEPAALGPIVTGSLTWCQDALAWTTPEGDVRRWSGGDVVDEVFTADPARYLGVSTLPVCGGDTLSFTTTEGTPQTPGDRLRAVTLAAPL